MIVRGGDMNDTQISGETDDIHHFAPLTINSRPNNFRIIGVNWFPYLVSKYNHQWTIKADSSGRRCKEGRIEFKAMEINTGTAEPEIQIIEANKDSLPREDPANSTFDQSAVAPGGEAPSALTQSATHPQYFVSESKRISVIQVALALFAASLVLMLAMPGGMDERGILILGNSNSFNVYLVTNMLALIASLAVAMILAFDHRGKIVASMEIILVLAAASFLSALMAAGFVLNIHAVKWIMVSFMGAGAMVVAVLIYRRFIYRTKSNTPLAIQMSKQHQILNAV